MMYYCRFLAEYDSALYKAALKASLTAKNDDPETHESLADELLAHENALCEQIDYNEADLLNDKIAPAEQEH